MKTVIILLGLFLLLIIYLLCSRKENLSHYFLDLDIVYFINLDHRKDRLNEFLNEMKQWGIPMEKVKRIPAIYDKNKRDLSCSRSHIKTLEEFINSPYKNCIIFEDDFQFYNPEYARKTIKKFFKDNIPYDVVMLSSNTVTEEPSEYPYLNKIINSQTASGYLVNKSFSKTLLDNYKEGEKLFSEAYETDDKKDYIYAVDQYWKRLQPQSRWYVFNPNLGKQSGSISDIVGGSNTILLINIRQLIIFVFFSIIFFVIIFILNYRHK